MDPVKTNILRYVSVHSAVFTFLWIRSSFIIRHSTETSNSEVLLKRKTPSFWVNQDKEAQGNAVAG